MATYSSTYALTISPPPRRQGLSYLYRDDKPVIQKLLNRCSKHYIMYPEVDATGRLHYHGIVILNSLSSFGYVKSKITNLIGFNCLKPIRALKDKIGWILYCQKEHQEVMPVPIMPHKFPPGRAKRLCRPQCNLKVQTFLDFGMID